MRPAITQNVEDNICSSLMLPQLSIEFWAVEDFMTVETHNDIPRLHPSACCWTMCSNPKHDQTPRSGHGGQSKPGAGDTAGDLPMEEEFVFDLVKIFQRDDHRGVSQIAKV